MNDRGTRIMSVVLLLAICAGAATAQDNSGEVQIYVFSDTGLPMEGVETRVNDEVYTSDENGLITFVHPPGKHEFQLTYQGRTVSRVTVPVRQGQATEVLLTVSPEAESTQADVEAAEEAAPDDERTAIDETLPTGRLAGTVTHIETGDPVANATVIFRGVDYETTTDADGAFTAEVPEGDYSISVIHPDFSTQTMDEIQVSVGETTSVAMELTPSAIELDAVPVFAVTEVRIQGGVANLIDESRNSEVVLNLIGTEHISRLGDSDAAGALRRVTGLTVVGGRYVYVRGMGERYSSSFLNGALIPSPELDKRVVPLDLFPTSVIESMAVQKSYSPDMPGDFGGGAVRLRTIGIPDDRYARRLRGKLSFSVGYDTDSTLTERLMEDPGTIDFLGIDDGGRALPDEVKEADREGKDIQPAAGGPISGGLSPEELEAVGESFPNTWAPSKQLVLPDASVQASIRDKIDYENDSSLALSASLLYKHGFGSGEGAKKSYYSAGEDTLVPSTNYETSETHRNVDIGALFDIAYKAPGRWGIESTSLLVRTTENSVQQYGGWYRDDSTYVDVTETKWVEQMLVSERLSGNIGLPILNRADVDWQYSFALASRKEPDHRYSRYDSGSGDGDWELSGRAEGAQRIYADVTDFIHDGLLQVNIPVLWFGNGSADFIEFGAQGVYQTRETDTRRFWFNRETAGLDPSIKTNRNPEEIFAPENIGPDGFYVLETTLTTDNYTASQLLLSGFLATDILLLRNLRLNAGVRVEYSDQQVDTFDLFTEEPVTARLHTITPLPALNLTLPFAGGSQMRFGVSKTVNRPDLRELSTAPKDGLVGEGQLRGNDELKQADIYNADLRYERYITEEESLSFGVFGKYFVNAIEVQKLVGAANTFTFVNVPAAYNVGAELEWQLSFSLVSDLMRGLIMNVRLRDFQAEQRFRRIVGGLSTFFRDVKTSGNVALIHSRVDYQGVDIQGVNTSVVRPLQGQSPYVINVSLGYENSVSWSQMRPLMTSIFLNYNVFGPRISRLGAETIPDYYEQPFHQLDLVFKQRFSYVFSISFKAQNLLDLPAVETVGEDQEISRNFKGRTFSLGASFDF